MTACRHPANRRVTVVAPEPGHDDHDCMTRGCHGIERETYCTRCWTVLDHGWHNDGDKCTGPDCGNPAHFAFGDGTQRGMGLA